MEVPRHFNPRPYQARFIREARDKSRIVLKWARRAGKGLSTFAYAITRMVEEPMGVIIIYPTKDQGYDAFWNNVENDGFRTIEHIPEELIESKTSTRDNMSIRLKNGSTLTLLGGNANPQALRGQNTKLYILSEFVDISPGVMGIIRPVVIANGGQIIIESTVKQDGIQGATFLRLFKAAEKNPNQLAMRVEASEYMTPEQLEEARQEYIIEYGNDFLFRQEFLLDEGQALETSYYGNVLAQAKKGGRIGTHPHDPNHPVYTSWDLGKGAGTTAIAFWQYIDKKMHYIDAHTTHSLGDEAIAKHVLSLPYKYGCHFWPHDGTTKDTGIVNRNVAMQGYGLNNLIVIPRTSDKEDGIRRTVDIFRDSTTTFHEPMLDRTIDKLKLYKRKFNATTGDYEGPEHKSESHIADAFRYSAEALQYAFDPTRGKLMFDFTPPREDEEDDDLISGFGAWGEDDYDF